MKTVILVGGGASISEGINKDLWNKIKDKEVWSLNYAWLTMPYLPKRELWVDINFFKFNIDKLQELYKKGVECVAKKHGLYNAIPEIKQYEVTRDRAEMNVKPYIGGLGLCGVFALSVAIKEGYDDICLLGYDFGSPSLNEKKTHYYQDYLAVVSSGVGRPEVYMPNNRLHESINDFNLFLQYSVKIFNISMISNIQCFPKLSYEEFFQKIQNE